MRVLTWYGSLACKVGVPYVVTLEFTKYFLECCGIVGVGRVTCHVKSNWMATSHSLTACQHSSGRHTTPCNLLLTTSSADWEVAFPPTVALQVYIPACVALSMTSTRSILSCSRTAPLGQLNLGQVHWKFGVTEDSTPTTRHTRTTLVPCSTVVLGKASMMTVERLKQTVYVQFRYDRGSGKQISPHHSFKQQWHPHCELLHCYVCKSCCQHSRTEKGPRPGQLKVKLETTYVTHILAMLGEPESVVP